MTRRPLAHTLLAFTALASCSGPPAPPRSVVVDVSSVPRNVPTAVETAEPAPPAKPPDPPAEPEHRHRVALTLRPGDPPCALVMDGGMFADHPEWFVITAVSRMATEEGGACAASVFYELANETKDDPADEDPSALVAGIFRKPGKTLPADMAGDAVWNVTEDLDFDDYADLCVVVMTGAYNYSQQCWLFDPKSRTFVRHKELDDLIFMNIDRKNRKLSNGYRAGGPVYQSNEYEWQNGRLVKTREVTRVLGQKLDGSPLPSGFAYWIIRHELRNGVLVKTFEGPVRDTP